MDECHTCQFEEIGLNLDDSPIVDQDNCKESPTEITKVKCPSWARTGCFVGDSVQLSDDGNDIVNIYRHSSKIAHPSVGPNISKIEEFFLQIYKFSLKSMRVFRIFKNNLTI